MHLKFISDGSSSVNIPQLTRTKSFSKLILKNLVCYSPKKSLKYESRQPLIKLAFIFQESLWDEVRIGLILDMGNTVLISHETHCIAWGTSASLTNLHHRVVVKL